MTGNNEKKTVTIPVPAHYVTDTMIAGVKKEDLRTMWFGDFEMTVFFTEVPEEQARDLLKLTWAEVNFDKPKRRRLKAGIKDCELTAEIESMIPSECFEDPLQLIIDKEAMCSHSSITILLRPQTVRYCISFSAPCMKRDMWISKLSG